MSLRRQSLVPLRIAATRREPYSTGAYYQRRSVVKGTDPLVNTQMLLRRDYRIDDYQINTHESLVDAKNDRLHVDERRYASLLKLTAGGTLVMGIWSMLKILMNTFAIPVSGAASFAVLFAIVIFLRYTVWTGASKEADDGKRRIDYIACTLVLLAYGIFTVIRFIRDLISRDVTGQDISGFIFDLTSMILLCEVLHSAFRLRKVREGTAEVL